MKALMIIAHGSKNPVFNEDISSLSARVASLNQEYDLIDHAFLELAEPDIPGGIESLVSRGASSITILPYFLARGNHVTRDIPDMVATARQEFPEVDIEIVDHIGASENIANIVNDHLSAKDNS